MSGKALEAIILAVLDFVAVSYRRPNRYFVEITDEVHSSIFFDFVCFVSSVMIVFSIWRELPYQCFISEINFLLLIILSFGINYAYHILFTHDFMHHCRLRNV